MKIDWKRKLSSRKFWALLASLVVAVLTGVLSDVDIAKIVSVISAIASCSIYMLAESTVDAANVASSAANVTETTTEAKIE